MSKIISINGKKDIENISNSELRKIVGIFNDNIDDVKEDLSNCMTKNNFNFLVTNYIEIINKLSKTPDECEELNYCMKTLFTIIENITSESTVIDCILVFFNLLRVCGLDINKLSIKEICAVINIYYTYEHTADFSNVDCFAYFLLDENFFEQVRNYNYSKHDLSMFFVDAASCCLEDNIFSTKYMKKYVQEILENYSIVGVEKNIK